MSDSKLTFAMTLENDLARQFIIIKKYYGLENNTEIMRILIHDKYRELFPNESREAQK